MACMNSIAVMAKISLKALVAALPNPNGSDSCNGRRGCNGPNGYVDCNGMTAIALMAIMASLIT